MKVPRPPKQFGVEPSSGQFVARESMEGLPRKDIFEGHIARAIEKLEGRSKRAILVAERLRRAQEMKEERDGVVEGSVDRGVKRKLGEGEEEEGEGDGEDGMERPTKRAATSPPQGSANFFETAAGIEFLNSS